MKTRKFILSALATLLVAGSVTSCHDDNDDDSSAPHNNATEAQSTVTKSNIISSEDLTAQEYANKYLKGDSKAQSKFLKSAKHLTDSISNECGENGGVTKYRSLKYKYWSVDENGRPIELSAFMVWSHYTASNNTLEIEQNKVVMYSPYTHTLDSECASVSEGGFEIYALVHDNLVIMPDYEGFGITAGRTQLYLNHEIVGRQNYDALVEGKKLFEAMGGKYKKDCFLISAGCSQGGGNAVAFQKYIETTRGADGRTLADIQNFKYTRAAVGAYCPELTYKEYLNWGKAVYPVVLPLTIKSMMVSYPEEFKGIDESRFFSDAYNAHKAEFDAIFLNNTKSSTDIVNKMINYLGSPKEKSEKALNLTSILSEEALNVNSDLAQKLIKCLRKSDLTTGWTPQHTIYIYQCEDDLYVPYANSVKLKNAFPSMVVAQTYPSHFNHLVSCITFIGMDW